MAETRGLLARLADLVYSQAMADAVRDVRHKVIEEPWFGRTVTPEFTPPEFTPGVVTSPATAGQLTPESLWGEPGRSSGGVAGRDVPGEPERLSAEDSRSQAAAYQRHEARGAASELDHLTGELPPRHAASDYRPRGAESAEALGVERERPASFQPMSFDDLCRERLGPAPAERPELDHGPER